MSFEDVLAVLERAFNLKLKVVEGATAFEVASEDGETRVKVFIQNADERRKVLLSADIGEPPPEGGEQLLRIMMEANHLFTGTAGSTLALDTKTGRFRLQRYESPEDLANNAEAKLVSFIETALLWSRSIADFKPSADVSESEAPADFGMIQV